MNNDYCVYDNKESKVENFLVEAQCRCGRSLKFRLISMQLRKMNGSQLIIGAQKASVNFPSIKSQSISAFHLPPRGVRGVSKDEIITMMIMRVSFSIGIFEVSLVGDFISLLSERDIKLLKVFVS